MQFTKTNKFIVTLGLLGLSTILTGCGISSSGTLANTGSIYRTENYGNTWMPKASIMGVARVANFGAANVWTIKQDPTDNMTVYVGTVDSGMYVSNDSGEGWQWVKSLGKVYVRSIAIDPQYRCTIFAAVSNKLYRSIDCGRSFVQTYYDNDQTVTVNSVITDPKNGAKVYIGTSRGEVIRSTDRGMSWQTINRFDSKLTKLYINPQNGSSLYAATTKDGVSVSTDGGTRWKSLAENLKSFEEGTSFKDMAFSGENANSIYIVTRYGLLHSSNNGSSWLKIELITPKEKATINALAVDPTDENRIYYSTNTTFYSSKDGGKNWTTKALPTARVGWTLVIDPKNTAMIFMGMREIKK